MIKNIPTATIGQLLAEQYPFFVPIYQRAYAWEEEEIEDFINDIAGLYRKRLDNPKVEPEMHFFGGMVCVHHYASNRTNRRHEVVDGQQRLATFTLSISLIIRTLRNLSRQTSDPAVEQEALAYAEEMEEDYMIYREVEGGQRAIRYKLTLSKADGSFFKQIIAGNPPEPERVSHKRIRFAYDKIQRDLTSPIVTDFQISDREKLGRLLCLKACITDDCQVIHIVCDDRQSAYRLFSILNDRGRTLSDGDLLRAYSLEILEKHPDLQEMVEQYWDKILSGSQTDIDKFLRAYYPSHVGQRAPQRDLSDKYREKFFDYSEPIAENNTDGAIEVEKRIANMASEADLFVRIRNGEWPYENPQASAWERDRLNRLGRVLGHELCFPLLLSACCKLSEERFVRLVSLLERFVFRYVIIVRAHPATLYKPYYEHTTAIRQNPDNYNIEPLASDLRQLVEERASDEQFRIAIEETMKYSRSSTDKRIIKYFLSTIDDFKAWYDNGAAGTLRTDQVSSFDINQISIEHIYPQNPITQDPEMEPVKQHIGNLTFWGPDDNTRVGNLSFREKKARYAASRIKLTNELAQLDDWNRREFDRRQHRLIDMALKLFRV